jgi:hypothetical protein
MAGVPVYSAAMRRARCGAILLVSLAVLVGPAWSQAAAALKESRGFYQDVAGYHAQGKAEAVDRTEAQRLAKAAALRRLFSEIGKDVIFAEMCISGWPEYITVEEAVSQEREGKHLVQVQVVVATSAIMLTEQKYLVAVADLLSEAERVMAGVEKDLAEADGFERNLKVAEALGAYRKARARALRYAPPRHGSSSRTSVTSPRFPRTAATSRPSACVWTVWPFGSPTGSSACRPSSRRRGRARRPTR